MITQTSIKTDYSAQGRRTSEYRSANVIKRGYPCLATHGIY